jgi:hypothetical protein
MNSGTWRLAFTRIQVEYIEMPDLKLTPAQLGRLCDLSEEVCEPAIAALEQAGFLWRTPDGRFVRRAVGHTPRAIQDPYLDPVLGSYALMNQRRD